MSRLVAVISKKGENVVQKAFHSARLSQHGGTGAYYLELDGKKAIHENDILPYNKDDMVYSALQNLKGSIALCLITKNPLEKERSIMRGSLLDGYITNSEILLEHPLLDYKESSNRVALTKIIKKYFAERDLYSINEIFSDTVKGVGMFRVENGILVSRDRTGWRTIWVGHDEEDDSYIAAQESYIFDHFGIKDYRELQPRETLLMTQKGDHAAVIDMGKLEFDPQQIIHDFHPNTRIFDRSVYEIRGLIGKNLARRYADFIRKPDAEILVTSLSDGTRHAAFGLAKELDKILGKAKYEEVYFPRRESSVSEQQSNFDRDKDFPFYYSAFPAEEDDFSEGPFKPEKEALAKGKNVIAVDDSLITGLNARKHGEIMELMEAKYVHYTTEHPPIVDKKNKLAI